MGRAGRKMPALPAFPHSTLCSRWPTSKGPELNGVGPIPGLAGRSPSYLVRQLYDFQHGTRAGPLSPLMAPNVMKLTLDDMVALAAYAASLSP